MRITHRLRAGAAAVVAALLLAGCGEAAAPKAAEEPSASAGDPGVVVALDDFAAINAISLGVQPDLVLDVFGYQTSKTLWTEFGLKTQPYGAELDIEKVIAARPDVIIGSSIPTNVSQRDKLSKIAKTAIVDYTAGWQTQLRQTADALGRTSDADRVIGRVTGELATLKKDLAASPFAGQPISVLSNNQGIYSVPERSGLGSLLRDAGLDRPAPQKATTDATSPFVMVSAEDLKSHDGSAVFLMTGGAYDPKPITDSPLWPRLTAVASGKVYEVNAELWFGTSPFAVDWILDDVRAALLGQGRIGTANEAGRRLREFVAVR
ncbi:ABC transporter substrate-binding protein [Micromonospora sp. NPDC005324]|uniref:ABC transporter substrate-binding protein n=1 Tax=Micromonospora sp. NPDC005324 TaxID=3157033 RepID=UPI0033A078D4